MSNVCTIQDVFHRFYPSYENSHDISPAQRKTAYHIMNCKTGAFGANVSICEDCGCISIHYNSCRDRCCPMCQEFPKEKWVDARREDILDAPYFHVVFTVPEELNPVIYSNQKLLYTALYHAASDTLSELAADNKYLGADIGYICILHTWGSAMNFHPHIHAIVLGGGLDIKNHWKDNGEEFIRRFLMHVPPKRFVRIRHYGLLSSRNKNTKITMCRNILGCQKYISRLKDMDAPAIILLLYNKDICKCSSCGGKILPLSHEQYHVTPKPHMLC